MKRVVFLLFALLLTTSVATASDVHRQLNEIRSYISADPARALSELEEMNAAAQTVKSKSDAAN